MNGSALGSAFSRLREHIKVLLGETDDQFGQLQRIVDAVLDRSVVIHAHCKTGFDPFVVFSTLNATGLPLTASQILRARSLGLVSSLSSRVQDETKKAWDSIEKLDEDADRFLQAFLILRTGQRVQAKDVVRTFDRVALASRNLPEDKRVTSCVWRSNSSASRPATRHSSSGSGRTECRPRPSGTNSD